MFRNETQTSPLSLFSSASSHPLALFSTRCDADLLGDSAIVLVHDATDAILARPAAPVGRDDSGYGKSSRLLGWPSLPSEQWTMRGGSTSNALDPPAKSAANSEIEHDEASAASTKSPRKLSYVGDTVLHIQSPTLASTYIQAGSSSLRDTNRTELGIIFGFVHLQLRMLGESRPFMMEVGVRDTQGRGARLRWSTFGKRPRLTRPLGQASGGAGLRELDQDQGLLLHMPLSLPSGEYMLTPWRTMAAPVAAMCKYLSAPPAALLEEHDIAQSLPPFGTFSSIAYIRIHANCRLRRVWFTDHRSSAKGDPRHYSREFALYAKSNKEA